MRIVFSACFAVMAVSAQAQVTFDREVQSEPIEGSRFDADGIRRPFIKRAGRIKS